MFDRDEQEISQIIESGLEAILTGRATLEEVLAEHPGQAEEIRGELEGALWLISRRQEVEARPGFVAASRKRVIERISAEASSQGTKRAFFGFAWPRRLAFQWVAALAVVLMMILGTGGVVTMAQSALPGDELYAVKRAAEQVTYTVTLSEVERVELSAQFASRRLNEVETLMAKGNYREAELTIKEFERQVKQAITLLQNVSNTNAKEKLSVAVSLKDDLQQHALRLADMQAGAPAAVRNSLSEAEGVANLSASTTGNIIDKIPGATATPDETQTPTSTDTIEPVESVTPTPAFTSTPSPEEIQETETAVPNNTPVGVTLDSIGSADEPEPSETLTPGDPSATPKAVRTPKPSQKQVPVKPDNSKGKSADAPGKNK